MGEIDERLNAILSDPGEMSKIMAMAGELNKKFGAGADNGQERTENAAVGGIIGGMSETDDKTVLLMALKPYLRPERQKAVDSAVRLVKIVKVMRVAMEKTEENGNV